MHNTHMCSPASSINDRRPSTSFPPLDGSSGNGNGLPASPPTPSYRGGMNGVAEGDGASHHPISALQGGGEKGGGEDVLVHSQHAVSSQQQQQQQQHQHQHQHQQQHQQQQQLEAKEGQGVWGGGRTGGSAAQKQQAMRQAASQQNLVQAREQLRSVLFQKERDGKITKVGIV